MKQTSEQNRTSDMEKEQTDSDQRSVRMGMIEERRGKVRSRNVYEGPMDKENGRGQD